MARPGRRDELREEIRAGLGEARAQFEAANARIEAKAGRNLFLAIGVGLLLGALFLLSLFIDKAWFALFVGFFTTFAVIELATAFRVSGRRVPRIGAAIGALLIIVGTAFWHATGMLIGLFAAAALLVLWRLIESLVPRWDAPPKTLLRDVVSGIFVLVYGPFLGGFAILLSQADRGQWWAFTLVLLVVACDVGAYAAGVTLGRHKMTPRISPNKTWEGFAGAAVLAVATGIPMSIFALREAWWVGAIFAIIVLFTATGGDLAESLIKRNLGVKDMSSWVPGHGGLFDRLDSLLPSAVGGYAVALVIGVFA